MRKYSLYGFCRSFLYLASNWPGVLQLIRSKCVTISVICWMRYLCVKRCEKNSIGAYPSRIANQLKRAKGPDFSHFWSHIEPELVVIHRVQLWVTLFCYDFKQIKNFDSTFVHFQYVSFLLNRSFLFLLFLIESDHFEFCYFDWDRCVKSFTHWMGKSKVELKFNN